MSRVRSIASMVLGSLGIALITALAGAVCGLESAIAQTDDGSACAGNNCNFGLACTFTPYVLACTTAKGACLSQASQNRADCAGCGCTLVLPINECQCK